MIDLPFHVAGGTVLPRPQSPVDAFVPESPLPNRGSRRKRLWELAHKCHCPVVGVCFGVDELRRLMARVMHFPRGTDDFVLHTTAVGACESRGPLSELLHKALEKRFAQEIRRGAAAKDTATLRDLWRQARAAGNGIAGALWTCWSHPACDKALEQEIYGDIHMLQHQVGSGTRADLGALRQLREENARLRQQLAESRQEANVRQREQAREAARLGGQITELQVVQAGREAWAANLVGQLDALRQVLPDLKDRQALARRASDAEARVTALTARAAALENEASRLRRQLQATTSMAAVAAAPVSHDVVTAPDRPETLQGKCILCVGGRSGAVEAYRQLVEDSGGRFLHHDGGLEESLHRIDAALAAADLVICQAGCISHNAYWRVKEQCKRTGKRCIYMKSTGVSSFARTVASAAASAGKPDEECSQP